MKKRKLKHLLRRKPKEIIRHRELIDAIVAETNFSATDVKKVIKSYIGLMRKELIKGKQVKIFGIGTLYRSIKPPTTAMNLHGGVGVPTKMSVPPKWIPKFNASQDLDQDLAKIKITKEELNNIYVN